MHIGRGVVAPVCTPHLYVVPWAVCFTAAPTPAAVKTIFVNVIVSICGLCINYQSYQQIKQKGKKEQRVRDEEEVENSLIKKPMSGRVR